MARTPFHRIRRLFDELVELPPGERSAFLARQNDLGENTRRHLHNLLRADAQVDHLDVRTALGEGAQVLAQEPRWTGRRIGAFEIRTPLDQGGRGDAWLAQRVDGHGEHCVAIKLLRPALRGAVARLRRERPLPTPLQHPAIAALLELGALDDGNVYAVMEYIDGLPIDRHVREHRLALAPRVQLLLPLCDAVAQAHRQRIVHGDIRPAKVLIDRSGQPKLLDIGIAALLQDASGAPGMGQTAADPGDVSHATAQPLRGAAVGASCDIYALGLLLYQLLAGVPPFDAEPGRPAPLQPPVADREPPPPSQRADDAARGRRLRLPRDLELIALHCLQPQPHDRYACVDALADDLRRYLQGRPVRVRNGKLLYRSGRLLVRHRLAVGLSLLLAAAALGVGMLR